MYFACISEGLSSLIHKEINENRWEELKIVQRAPGISHLLFAMTAYSSSSQPLSKQ
jgi:hypothetical protein